MIVRPFIASVSRLALALVAMAAPAFAQVPLTLVDDETTVSSVGFDFVDGQTLEVANLQLQIATKAPPGKLFGIIPRGDNGGTYPLNPIELAKDVVRLTRYYEDSGFPRAEVDYDVVLDTTDNAAAVTFVIEEGPPLVVGGVSFAGPGQSDVGTVLAPELRDEWGEFTQRTAVRSGDRLDQFALVQLQSETISWLRNRGYAWADAGAEQFPDSTGLVADIRVKVNVGERAVIGPIRIEGDSTLAPVVLLRELPFRTGDLFDASELADGQREIFGLGLFTLALVDIDTTAVRGEPTVPIVVRVRRGPARVVQGFAGYFTDGGVTLRGSATHRNAFGGARQLGANLEWRTGIASGFGGTGTRSVTGGSIRDLRVAVPFRQPYFFDRRLSYTLQPSYRDRDDEIESSVQAEVANTVLYTAAPFRTVALSLTGRARDLSRGLGIRLLDTGAFALPPGPLLPDTLRAVTGVLGLDVVWGSLDDPLQPKRGFVLRPSLALAAGDVSYGRARLAASATVPLGGRRTNLLVRGVLGTLQAFGGSDPDSLASYVQFRDQLFYAGGSNDVRGWSSALLGPKTLSITPPVLTPGVAPDPSIITSPRDVNYVGIGGQYKMSASVQLNLPLNALGPQWGAQVFVDAGGVWSPSVAATAGLIRAGGQPADSTLADLLEEDSGIRIGTGAGIQYLTPIGFVSVGLGFKLNPSYLDLHNAAVVYCGPSIYDADPPVCFGGDEVNAPNPSEGVAPGYIDARLNGSDFDPADLPGRGFFGRLQLYISIGQTF